MELQVSDRAMLVGTAGFDKHLYVVEVTIKSVWKNGVFALNETTDTYDDKGSKRGYRGSWSSQQKLQPWCDRIWQDFQRGEVNRSMASKLFKLGEVLQRTSRKSDDAAAVWEILPYSVQQLIKTNTI